VSACSACGAQNPDTKRFCGDCGTALATVCSACGGTQPAGTRFCGDCGASLDASAVPAQAASPSAPQAAERRVVSVLFVDLVGFTSASEGRDAEETRELLTRYFDV
jgi:predicted amidophosphoribosyltransferase